MENKKGFLFWASCLIGAISIGTTVYGIYLFYSINLNKGAFDYDSNLGQYLSGTSGIIISLGTSGFLLLTLLLTLQQLKIQREQFKLEKFDSKFYNRLEFLEKTVLETVIVTDQEIEFNGRDAFYLFNNKFKLELDEDVVTKKMISSMSGFDVSNQVIVIKKFQDYFQSNNGWEIFEFFLNNFYNILLFTHNEKGLDVQTKREYVRILFTQLDPEQLFLFGMVMKNDVLFPKVFNLLKSYPVVKQKWLSSERRYRFDNFNKNFTFKENPKSIHEPFASCSSV